MRLIDADKLLEYIDIGRYRHPDELSYSEVDLANMVNSMSTVLTNKELEEIVTALEEFISHLRESGMEDCTCCDLNIVNKVRGKLTAELLKGRIQ